MTCEKGLHAPVVTVSHRIQDWLRGRYWVRCWNCDLKEGPFDTRTEANKCANKAYRGAL